MRNFSYWEYVHGIADQHRTLLNPVKKTDIVIAGAGFAGSWLAYFLKKQNPKLDVVLFERDQFSYGASSRNAGFLSCGNISEWCEDMKELGKDEALNTFAARIEGIEIIRSAMGDQLTVTPYGSVDLDEANADRDHVMSLFNSYLRDSGRKDFFSRRCVNIAGKPKDIYFNSYDGGINPCDVLIWLHKEIRKLGVEIYTETHVTSMRENTAQWQQGQRQGDMTYRYAYICTNAFAESLKPNTDVAPARGQIMLTSPCTSETFQSLGFLNAGYDYYRFVDSRLLVGGGRMKYKDDETTNVLATSTGVQDYLKDLAANILGHTDFSIDHAWAGIMGLRQGKHASATEFSKRSMVDTVTEDVNACGGWGVTLTPGLMRQRANAWR